MASRYCSFLVRVHARRRATERIEIEHIQSGEKTRVTSATAAITWIRARSHAPASDDAQPTDDEDRGDTAMA